VKSFFTLIDRMNAAPADDRARLEAEVWAAYGVERAILTLDMTQFSLSVRRGGILHYLGLIRRMQVATAPIVRACGGEVVKFEADNLMAVFPDVPEAVEAALRMHAAFPVGIGAEGAAIGVDYGRFLMIPGTDCFGDAVNTAYKLGEDLARPGETLITQAARQRLPAAFEHGLREQNVSISGLELCAFCVETRSR